MYYTKYRPQTIADLDNQHIRETLGKTLLENKWAQAYLLTGPRGTGKTTTARLIAKIVNCISRKTGEEPCNKCDSCLSITNGNALDVVEIDAASNRGIDEIRDLRDKVKLAPSQLTYKVYIIDEVHMLTNEAFNALLKTVEEPPAHVIFVLATTDVQKLPQTIISRCQHFEFTPSSISETVRALERAVKDEKLEIDPKVLPEISQAADGSFRDAHKLLEQLVNLNPGKVTLADWETFKPGFKDSDLAEFADLLFTNKKKEALAKVESYVASGRKIKELQTGLINFVKELLFKRLSGSAKDKYVQISQAELVALLEELIKATELARFSPLPQLPLELVVAKWGGSVLEVTEELGAMDGLEEKKQEEKKVEEVAEVPKVIVSDNLEPADVETSKWPEILAALKPHNHSLVAFLRAAKPMSKTGDTLIIEVFYKFHKEKLDEKKNRDTLEKVISDIMGHETKIKFVLGEKNNV